MIQTFLFLGIPILLKDKLDIFATSYSRLPDSTGSSPSGAQYSSRLRTFLSAYKWACRTLALLALATIFLGVYQYGLIVLQAGSDFPALGVPSPARPSAAVSSFEWNERTRTITLLSFFSLLVLLKLYLVVADIIRGCKQGI
jgi:hypothetical protein